MICKLVLTKSYASILSPDLARLGISEASSILDATHFITDKFVRTRNFFECLFFFVKCFPKIICCKIFLKKSFSINQMDI